jgi:hypothetical protein
MVGTAFGYFAGSLPHSRSVLLSRLLRGWNSLEVDLDPDPVLEVLLERSYAHAELLSSVDALFNIVRSEGGGPWRA